jgi:hypothetical protein
MTDAAELAASVATHLGPALSPNLTAADRACDLYEAYVFTLVLRAARMENFTILYESITTPPAGVFTFRTSPGHIYTATQPYSYAVLTAQNGLTLEVHVGIRLLGKSRVAHECDVLVLDRDEALACRANRVDPLHTKAELAIERKFYASSLGLDLLRGFIGLWADLGGPRSSLVSNVSSSSMAQLFKSHQRSWEDHLRPGSAAEERFIGDIRSALHRFQSQ